MDYLLPSNITFCNHLQSIFYLGAACFDILGFLLLLFLLAIFRTKNKIRFQKRQHRNHHHFPCHRFIFHLGRRHYWPSYLRVTPQFLVIQRPCLWTHSAQHKLGKVGHWPVIILHHHQHFLFCLPLLSIIHFDALSFDRKSHMDQSSTKNALEVC